MIMNTGKQGHMAEADVAKVGEGDETKNSFKPKGIYFSDVASKLPTCPLFWC